MVLKPLLAFAKPSFAFSFRPQTSEPTSIDLNLSSEEYSADSEEYAINHSININDNVSKMPFLNSLYMLMDISKSIQMCYSSAYSFG
jgi:hypothetical protein